MCKLIILNGQETILEIAISRQLKQEIEFVYGNFQDLELELNLDFIREIRARLTKVIIKKLRKENIAYQPEELDAITHNNFPWARELDSVIVQIRDLPNYRVELLDN